MFVFIALGIGIGIAFGIEIAIGGHFDFDADSDPETDSDPGISRYRLYFRSRNRHPARRDPGLQYLSGHADKLGYVLRKKELKS